MKNERYIYNSRSGERGAALPTVLLISMLLVTASAAMLSAVGANSRNTSDVLAETKAYYAAESGLQASINVFRNDSTATYSWAVSNPTLAPKLTYATVNGVSQVGVGNEAGYYVYVTDPDHSSDPIVYHTTGTFQQADGTYAASRVLGSGSDTLTFTFNNYTSASSGVTQPVSNVSLGSLQIVKSGNGATIPNGTTLNFRIDYVVTAPRTATKTVRGSIASNGAITILTPYTVLGSSLAVQGSPTSITVNSSSSVAVSGSMAVIEPYRLKIASTGYGPNGATKQLEGIIQKNFFNDFPSGYALTLMAGSNCDATNTTFNVGTSSNMDIVGGSGPSVGTSTSAVLSLVTGAHTNGSMTPPPETMSADVPEWQQSPAGMDTLIRSLRQTAINSGRYFTSTNQPTTWGDSATGTGITFCEGSCNIGNKNGGGILVVTGTFTTSGNPTFKGLILAVGPYVSAQNPGGIVRSGGGQEVFTGNIVIAPYDPNNLAAGWGCPYYSQQGGAGDTINSDVAVDGAFDGTKSISNFMLAVGEK